MENQEKFTLTRRERVEAILDTLGNFTETNDFSINFIFEKPYVQLYDCLHEVAGRYGAKIGMTRTDCGSIERSAVIGGVEYTEVDIIPRKKQTCPVCGNECGRVFYSERGTAMGCDVCLTVSEEYEEAGTSETMESPDKTPET